MSDLVELIMNAHGEREHFNTMWTYFE